MNTREAGHNSSVRGSIINGMFYYMVVQVFCHVLSTGRGLLSMKSSYY